MHATSWWLAAAASPTEPLDGVSSLSSGQSLSPTSTTGWVLAATCSGSARDAVDVGTPLVTGRLYRKTMPVSHKTLSPACQPQKVSLDQLRQALRLDLASELAIKPE